MEQKEKRLSKEILDTVVFEVVEKDGSPYKRLMKEAKQ